MFKPKITKTTGYSELEEQPSQNRFYTNTPHEPVVPVFAVTEFGQIMPQNIVIKAGNDTSHVLMALI
jgi:hypothetical protein